MLQKLGSIRSMYTYMDVANSLINFLVFREAVFFYIFQIVFDSSFITGSVF